MQGKASNNYMELTSKLAIDCGECSGLCCVALCFMKTDGFPEDKEAGKPCKNLGPDFRCKIYNQLGRMNMKGCLAYDCFGAGQRTMQVYFPDITWKTNSEKANEIFKVFLIIFQMHQLLWYLIEAFNVAQNKKLSDEIESLILENEHMTRGNAGDILRLDVTSYRMKVNDALKRVTINLSGNSSKGARKDFIGITFKGENLDGRDFSMSLLIAANLEGCSLKGANFLGADMRDANIKNTDLSESLFLTQMQVNSARGNSNTKLPERLQIPDSWRSKIFVQKQGI